MLDGSGTLVDTDTMGADTAHLFVLLVPPSSMQVPATRQPLAIKSSGLTALVFE